MKSDNTCPLLLKRFDELTILDHPHLRLDDEAYYLGEYTCGKHANFSESNRTILNYKKSMERKGNSDWPYKEQSIQNVGTRFYSAIAQTTVLSERIKHATFVPIPPSVAKDSPSYDDRNLRMLRNFSPEGDVRELILQKTSRDPLHSSNTRDPIKIAEHWVLNARAMELAIQELWIFDDVLTQGTSFRAAHDFLKPHFPHAKIVGFFIARSVYPANL